MSESHAAAYAGIRARIRGIVEATDARTLDQVVPATPAWRAHDVLAHLVGVTNDVVEGRMEGLASDPWTQAQVDARIDTTPGNLLAEWEDYGPRFEAMLAAAPGEIAGQAIFDAATHEHDLRNALGIPGARDSDGIAGGWEWILYARTRASAHAVTFVTEVGAQTSGVGDVVARVEAPRFELFRAIAGRRTSEEMCHYRWDRDPDPALLLGADIFSFARVPLGE